MVCDGLQWFIEVCSNCICPKVSKVTNEIHVHIQHGTQLQGIQDYHSYCDVDEGHYYGGKVNFQSHLICKCCWLLIVRDLARTSVADNHQQFLPHQEG